MTPEEFTNFAKECAAENAEIQEAAEEETNRILGMLSEELAALDIQIIGFSGTKDQPEFHVYRGLEALAEYLGETEFEFVDRGINPWPWEKAFEHCGTRFFELRMTKE